MNPSQLFCPLCKSGDLHLLWHKESAKHKFFSIYKCKTCSIVHVNPQPSSAELNSCYTDQYFHKRTSRGYANYFSEQTKKVILQTLQKNLNDLKFGVFEAQFKKRQQKRRLSHTARASHNGSASHTPRASHNGRALDIGCAAGYFLEWLGKRGWQAEGIDISEVAASYGLEKKLSIRIGDYLAQEESPASYDLITLWASIEHLTKPKEILQRIHRDLRPQGRLIISTCRYGGIARLFGKNWRYINVPEHLFFFSQNNLKDLCQQVGFRCLHRFSYGSGINAQANTAAGLAAGLHSFVKKIIDFLAKKTNQGDMMVHYYERN